MKKRMFRLLTADEIECRVSTINEKGLTLLLYKDARCDMNILDETVGPMNWQKSYSRENANCTVGIWDEVNGQWVWKEDTGTQSQTEAAKGLASDSFKRACFNWGIGRELYTAPFVWIPVNSFNLTKNKAGKPATYDEFKVKEIGYDDAGRINALTIINQNMKNKVVYKLGKTKTEVYSDQQADEVNAEAVRKETIGETRARALERHLSDNGILVSTIYYLYRVKGLKDLTEAQHKNIVENIKKIKEAQDGSQSKTA